MLFTNIVYILRSDPTYLFPFVLFLCVMLGVGFSLSVTFQIIQGIRDGFFQGKILRRHVASNLGQFTVFTFLLLFPTTGGLLHPIVKAVFLGAIALAILTLTAFLWDRYWRVDHEEE